MVSVQLLALRSMQAQTRLVAPPPLSHLGLSLQALAGFGLSFLASLLFVPLSQWALPLIRAQSPL